MEEWNGNSLQGCLFSMPTAAAPAMQFASGRPILSDSALPRSVDLRPHCTPVEDQGRCNSCTANAVVGAMEYHLAKRDGKTTDLSRLFVYFNTRRLNGTFMNDMGATIPQAMAAALAFGSCQARFWPYDLARLHVHPPPQAYRDAMGHEALQFARAAGVDGAVRSLAEGLPVAFGVNLPKRCYDEAAQTGVMPETTAAERANKPKFGHAMLLVGYDLPARRFILRNSWGPGWADGGYASISFEDLEHCAPADQFWTLSDLEPAQNYRVSRGGFAPHRQAKALGSDAPSAVFGRTPAAPAAAPALGGAKSAAEKLRAEIRGEIDSQRAALTEKIDSLRRSDPTERRRSLAPPPGAASFGAGAPFADADPAADPAADSDADPGVIIPAPADSPYPVVAAQEYPPGWPVVRAETKCLICFGTGQCEMCGGADPSCTWCYEKPGFCRTCKGMKRIVLIVPKNIQITPEKYEE